MVLRRYINLWVWFTKISLVYEQCSYMSEISSVVSIGKN